MPPVRPSTSCGPRACAAGLLELQTLWPFPERLVRGSGVAGQNVVVVPELNLGQLVLPVRAAVGGAAPVRVTGPRRRVAVQSRRDRAPRSRRRERRGRPCLDVGQDLRAVPAARSDAARVVPGLRTRASRARARHRLRPAVAADLDQLVLVGGIGCAGRTPFYLNTNAMHTTHGRALAFATGLKLTRPELTVITDHGRR